jgi:hypothetical protein
VDVAVGDPIFLTARVDNLPAGGTVTWSNAVNLSPDGSGLSTVAYFYQGGEYTITATGGLWIIEDGHATPPPPEGSGNTQTFPTPGSASIVVRAYEVTAVTANPNPVAVGDPLTATATVIPGPPPPNVTITWSHGTPNGVTTAIAGLPVGYHDIMATCGSSSASANVAAVQVLKIQYLQPGPSGTWQDVSGTLYVPAGLTISFKAFPDPPGAPWPSGKPVWSGTSGASGSGETTTVPFIAVAANVGDTKTVIATCGNQKVATTLTYAWAPKFEPVIKFTGRSMTKFAVGEDIDLDVTITPPGLSAATVGDFKWENYDGTGVLNAPLLNGKGIYLGPETAANVTLSLLHWPKIGGGNLVQIKSVDLPFIVPTDLFFRNKFPWVYHVTGSYSIGVVATMEVLPGDVAWDNVRFFERGGEVGAGAGWFEPINGFVHVASGVEHGIFRDTIIPEANPRTFLVGVDWIARGPLWAGLEWPVIYFVPEDDPLPIVAPYANGSFKWDIDWLYRVVRGGNPSVNAYKFLQVEQKFNSDPTGAATLKKHNLEVGPVPLNSPTAPQL